MKNFWQGMSTEGTLHYLVQNKLSPAVDRESLAYAIGDDNFIDKATTKLQLIRNIIQWMLKKTLVTCQDCGTRNESVTIISDFHAAGTLCPECLHKRQTHWL